jgi:hypothetical protein
MTDAATKGRMAHGEKNGQAKLTSRNVTEIREASRLGETQASLARRFGVTDMAIHKIRTRQTWRRV